MRKKTTFWGQDDDDVFSHEDQHDAFYDAIEQEIEDIQCSNGDLTCLKPGSHTVEIVEMAHDTVSKKCVMEFLYNSIEEYLDSDLYQNDDYEFDVADLGEDVRLKMDELAKLISVNFKASLLHPTGEKQTVDVYKWCLEHEPEWLKDDEDA